MTSLQKIASWIGSIVILFCSLYQFSSLHRALVGRNMYVVEAKGSKCQMNYLAIMVTPHAKVFRIGNKREDSCVIREVNVTQSEML